MVILTAYDIGHHIGPGLVLENKFGLYYKLLYFRCSKAKIEHETP